MSEFRKHGAILLFAIAAVVCAGCTGDNVVSTDFGPDADAVLAAEDAGEFQKMGRSNGAVTVPFKATFSTEGEIVPDDDRCGLPPMRFNVQEGDGQATHLGNFSTDITFCVDITDVMNAVVGPDGNPLAEGESIEYTEGVGTFTGANGDVLEFTIEGSILPSDHPDYHFEFADTFEFIGGTGRFAGASGVGVTSSFVDFAAARTDHYWSGVLNLPRGR